MKQKFGCQYWKYNTEIYVTDQTCCNTGVNKMLLAHIGNRSISQFDVPVWYIGSRWHKAVYLDPVSIFNALYTERPNANLTVVMDCIVSFSACSKRKDAALGKCAATEVLLSTAEKFLHGGHRTICTKCRPWRRWWQNYTQMTGANIFKDSYWQVSKFASWPHWFTRNRKVVL